MPWQARNPQQMQNILVPIVTGVALVNIFWIAVLGRLMQQLLGYDKDEDESKVATDSYDVTDSLKGSTSTARKRNVVDV